MPSYVVLCIFPFLIFVFFFTLTCFSHVDVEFVSYNIKHIIAFVFSEIVLNILFLGPQGNMAGGRK